MIDLHAHTDESDGSLKPRELVELARRQGLEALAITDHDTFAGYEKARVYAESIGLDLVWGIELNSRINELGPARSAHLLAYFPQRAPSDNFLEWLEDARRERKARNQKLIEALKRNGVEITLEEVEAKGRSLTGRPHFARVLIEKGYAKSLEDAFGRYIGEEGASYVPRESLTTIETIKMVRRGGGIPVIAHPIRLQMDAEGERAFLQAAKSAGLLGLEVIHSEHSAELQAHYSKLALELKLLPTGGSDFHGPTVKPGIELGSGRARNVAVAKTYLNDMRAFAAKM